MGGITKIFSGLMGGGPSYSAPPPPPPPPPPAAPPPPPPPATITGDSTVLTAGGLKARNKAAGRRALSGSISDTVGLGKPTLLG